MNQNNIAEVLSNHPVIPVVTINNEAEIPAIVATLKANNIFCIEITLRTTYALDAIAYFKAHYADEFTVGVGTVVQPDQVRAVAKLGVDFIVSFVNYVLWYLYELISDFGFCLFFFLNSSRHNVFNSLCLFLNR